MPISDGSAIKDVGIRIRADGVVELSNGVKVANEEFRGLGKSIDDFAQRVDRANQATQSWGTHSAALELKTRSATQAIQEQARARSQLLEREMNSPFLLDLQKEAETLGMSAAKQREYGIAQNLLTEGARAQAEAYAAKITAYEAEQAALTRLKGAATAVGVGLVAMAGGFAVAVKHQIDLEAGMKTLSVKTGESVEQLSALKYAADLSDASLESLARGMRQLPKSLVEAGNPKSQAGRAFAFLEIDPTQIKSQQQALDELADAIQRVEDPMAASAALQMILKRNGDELLPFYKEGAEGIRRMMAEGQKLNEVSGVSAARAKELKDQLVRLEAQSSAVARVFGENLVIGLNASADAFLRNSAEGNKMLGVLAGVNALFHGSEKNVAEKMLVENTDKLLAAQHYLELAQASGNQKAIEGARLMVAQYQAAANSALAYVKVLETPPAAPASGKPQITGMPDPTGTAVHKQQSDFARLQRTASEHLALANEAASRTDKLTESERALAKITADYNDGLAKLTPQQYEFIKAELESATAAERAKISRDRVAKAYAEQYKEQEAAAVQFYADQARRQDAGNQERLALRDMTKQSEIAAMQDSRARAEEQFQWEIQKRRERISAIGAESDTRKGMEDDLASYIVASQAKLSQDLRPEWQKMLDAWSNTTLLMRESLDNFVIGGLRTGENMFIKFAQTGKLTIKDMTDFVIAETARMYYRENLAQPIASGLRGAGSWIAGMIGGGSSNPSSVNYVNSFDSGAMNSLVSHNGGVVGVDSMPTRIVPASAFLTARRYHSGGLAGDEVPAILQRGETVLARGQSAAPNVTVNVVNQSGTPLAAQPAAAPRFDGERWVIDVFVNRLHRDAGLRESVRGMLSAPA